MFFKKLFLFMLALATLPLYGAEQEQTQSQKSESILGKIQKIKVAEALFVLLLTPHQASDLLPVLQKAHQRVAETEDQEYKSLLVLEPALDTALGYSLARKSLCDLAVTQKIQETFDILQNKRMQVIQQNVQELALVIKSILQDWQINSLKNSATLPVSEEDKIQYFVKNILLSKDAYEILQNIAVESNSRSSREVR